MLRGDGSGGLTALAPLPLAAAPSRLAAGDFDRDGDADVAIASYGRPSLLLARSLGGGRFTVTGLGGLSEITGLLFTRYDADRYVDLVAHDVDGRLTVRLGRRGGLGRARVSRVGGDSLAAGDLDGDGAAEVVSGFTFDKQVVAARGRTDKTLGPATAYAVAGSNAIAIADVDRDGHPDLVAAGNRAVTILLNRGLEARAVPSVAHAGFLIRSDGAVFVRVRCSAGVGLCRGTLRLISRHRLLGDTSVLQRPRTSELARVEARGLRLHDRLSVRMRTDTGRLIAPLRVHVADPRERRAACFPPHLMTLARSATVRVFADGEGTACELASGRWLDLPEDPTGPFATRAHYVAYASERCGDGIEPCDNQIVLYDVRRRRVTARTVNEITDPPCTPLTGCGAERVPGLVVGARGALAWTTCGYVYSRRGCLPRARPALYRYDARGLTLLQTDPQLHLHSLRISPDGKAIAWTTGDQSHHANLQGRPPRASE